MNTSTATVSPDELFDTLLQGARPQRVRNLKLIHQICAAQSSSSKDLSIATVGRLCEAAGGLKARALYNAASRDYRMLIDAWREYTGAPSERRRSHAPEQTVTERHLLGIGDPALRALVQRVYVERNALRAELNLLKSTTVVHVDRRPSVPASAGPPTLEVLTGVQLTESERSALERSISPEFLGEEGWKEGAHGEIVNERGRKLFDVGFARAIRKVLDSAGVPKPR